jgi:hypothetical protein
MHREAVEEDHKEKDILSICLSHEKKPRNAEDAVVSLQNLLQSRHLLYMPTHNNSLSLLCFFDHTKLCPSGKGRGLENKAFSWKNS